MGRNRQAKTKLQMANDVRPETPFDKRPTSKALLAGVVTGLFVLRPLYPCESVAAEGDGLPVVMLWLLALMFWAILVARGSLSRVRFAWPDFAVVLLVLWHSIAALWAIAYESPRPALNMLWEWVGLGIAFFLARQAFASSLQRRAVGAVMIALAVIVSIYGLYQYSVELPQTREFYEQSSDEMLRQAGLWFPPGSPEREAFEQRLDSVEPMATFALTNSLAGFLAPWTIVALGVSVVLARRLTIKQRVAVASLLLPLGLCLLLTKSRSAFLACACGTAAVTAIWWFGRRARVTVRRELFAVGTATVLLVGAVFTALMTGGLDAEVLSEAPKSLGYRLQYWRSSAAMIRDMPIFGCGPGNFQHRYAAYKLPEASEEIADPHNFLMEVWATAGTPAMLALLGVGGAFSVCILRTAQTTKHDPTEAADKLDSGAGASSAIFLGALGGMLLSLPVGAMGEAPPTWWVSLAGIPLGATALAVLRHWVASGDDSAALWTLAVIVLLIHLLFAGGIAFPGIATGLWLLVALAMNASECGERPVRPRAGTLALGGSLALVAACYFTGYQPTLVARTQIQRAHAGDGDPRDLLMKAVAADPWATKPRRHLAEVIQQQWLTQPNAETLAKFDRAVQETLERAPRAASVRHQFGLAYCEFYHRSQDRGHLAKGIRLLESAASLYPNSCRMRADLAEAYLLADDWNGYERQRTEAFRLDSLTPHLDKKLSAEQRERFARTILAPGVRAPESK